MTITEIKQYILDNNKIEYILLEIGCHHIQYHTKGYYTCANKDGDNKSAIILYDDESLKCINYTRKISDNTYTDLITLIGFNMKLSFMDSIKYLHKILGLDFKIQFKDKKQAERIDPLEVFKKVKRHKCVVNKDDIEIYDESIIKEYVPLPHIDWIREGIMPWTTDVFRIGYSYDKRRIVIPERYWCGGENDYVGIMGRTTIPHYEMFDIKKYLALKSFSKTLNLYGLQENYKSIQEAGQVVVVESQKSVLKRHSLNDETVVAIGSHSLSEEQVNILIGLNISIIIAYDKGISLDYIRSECEKFYGIRITYYIYDKYDLLKDKESPADKLNKIYNYLFKYRVKYDEQEHEKYIKYKEKK